MFVAFKVKRVSAIDNVDETFRMRFHIYFTWLATEAEYKSYYEAKLKEELAEWVPGWIPNLEFLNGIEEHIRDWVEYGSEGKFRVQTFKDFAAFSAEEEEKDIVRFESKDARFIRAKLECDMTLAEELELQSFPFDVF